MTDNKINAKKRKLKKIYEKIMMLWKFKKETDNIDDISRLESEFLELYLEIYPESQYESGQDIIYRLSFDIENI
ncbi:MAG: hypothetical protein EAX96_06465 [Candidatus Lokiarchaeota archaeon]|nr:hypothetical protein [Candidatus Lokiarchaeota archaeon]